MITNSDGKVNSPSFSNSMFKNNNDYSIHKKNGHKFISMNNQPKAIEPRTSCSYKPECTGCGYPNHGFQCYNEKDGSCLKDFMSKISKKRKADNGESDQRTD